MPKSKHPAKSSPAPAPPPAGNGYFYCFPLPLLRLLKPLLRQLGTSPAAIVREVLLSRNIVPFSVNVGYWNRKARQYELLSEGTKPLTKRRNADQLLKGVMPNRTPQSSRLAHDELHQRLERIRNARSAYCGWLLSNPDFRKEHDDLLVDFGPEIKQFGFPQISIANFGDLPEKFKAHFPGLKLQSDWTEACLAFYEKWHLECLAGPYLPVPFSVQAPTQLAAVTSQMEKNGKLFYWPACAPLLAAEDLRALLQDVLRFQPPPHLADWMKIISNTNSAKNQLPAHARRFRLFHFWRLLELRHARGPLPVQKLEVLFGRYLRVTTDSIKRDRLFLSRRLGKNWSNIALLSQFCTP